MNSKKISINNSPSRYYPKLNFPSYRHIPGLTPHPISDPNGHSFNKNITDTTILTNNNWNSCSTFLYAIDLFNYAYFWEAHEYLEELWKNLTNSSEKLLLQAIIQSAAALIKNYQNNTQGMIKLFTKSRQKFENIFTETGKNTLLGIRLDACISYIDCFLKNSKNTSDCDFTIKLTKFPN